MGRAQGREQGVLRVAVPQGVRVSLEQAWRDWVAWEREFQKKNLEAIREHPTTPARDIGTRALGSVSRAHLSRDGRQLYAAFNYPGTVAHVGALALVDGGVRKLADIKGPSIYTVTSLAHDPETDTLFYDRQQRLPRHRAPRPGHREVPDAPEGRADRRARSLTGRPVDLGHPSPLRHLHARPHPYPWTEWKRVRSWAYGDILYDLDLSPDGKLLSASVGEITGRNTSASSRRSASRRTTRRRWSSRSSPGSSRPTSSSPRTAASSTGARSTRGSRTSSATSSPRRPSRR